mmetsp:Transcript_50351/g.100130  ORF Transcript_50351/g.100130 Transcript_50351/m.100130 type:complete len:496 (-) Transcript_50351:661-2148(-)
MAPDFRLLVASLLTLIVVFVALASSLTGCDGAPRTEASDAQSPQENQELQILAKHVPINIKKTVTELPVQPGSSLVTLRWLGCLHLTATGTNNRTFGGLSGASLHGSRLIAVSDATKFNEPQPDVSDVTREDAYWGAGRLFIIDLHLERARRLKGAPKVLPAGVVHATAQLLRDRFGDIIKYDYYYGDHEAIAMDGPNKLIIGIEHTQVLRNYRFIRPLTGTVTGLLPGIPSIIGGHSTKSLTRSRGVGAELSKCNADQGNNGAEGIAMMPNGNLLVFCERNHAGGLASETVGWLADQDNGAIKATYRLPLPAVEGAAGKYYRVSGAGTLPGTSDVLLLFHHWSPQTHNQIKLAKVEVSERGPNPALTPTILRPTVLLELQESDGYPVDNYEAVMIQAMPHLRGSYIVHLLSDDNFNRKYQRTLLLSLHMQVEGGAEGLERRYGRTTPAVVLTAGAASAVAGACVIGVAAVAAFATPFREPKRFLEPDQTMEPME